MSQVIPTIQPHIRISAAPIAGHSEDFKEAACSELGLASIGLGAEVLAATVLRLIEDPALLARIKAEHAENVRRQLML